jgi:cysteine-rich repeat protein
MRHSSIRLFLAAGIAALASTHARAADIVGTVSFTGTVAFESPIAGIDADDIVVRPGSVAEATGNGEHCDVLSVTSDNADISGVFPGDGTVSVQIELGRGGMNPPDGTCLLTLEGQGNDGVAVSARGSLQVELTAADIGGNATVAAGQIVLRQSKTQAGVSTDCLKYIKKQLKLRSKCNAHLLRGGSEAADKCKSADPEPAACDDADYVETILALSHGGNDQQTDPASAQAVDSDPILTQLACQKYLGKAATGFTAVRTKLVQVRCIAPVLDTQACRDQATQDASAKLSAIDNCTGDQMVDALSGLVVPDLGEPCLTQCVDAGVLDRKCIKSCFELEIAAFSDAILGDVPECGNGIIQGGETCDDGNVAPLDGCSATCQLEP